MILQALSLSAKITKLPSDSPGSRCQSHHNNLSLSLATLQALSLYFLPKSLNLLHNKTANLTYNATQYVAAQSLSPIFLTLATTARNPIAYIYQIYHTAMGHRYFNLAVSCGICLRYAHASHKSASAFQFPIL